MARPIYQHELTDPDFLWLINSFRESRSGYLMIESSCLPVVLLEYTEQATVLDERQISEDSTDSFPE